MRIRSIRMALAALSLIFCSAAGANAQTSIPLSLVSPSGANQPNAVQRLQINVGINGGAPQPYMFDTGSSVFNAAYNPAWWGNVPSSSSLPTNVQFCYVGGTRCFIGNIVQVQSLTFAGASSRLTANPGYQVNAAFTFTDPGHPTLSFPSYFANNSRPFLDGLFDRVFGAGNFSTFPTANSPGGVLGQTMVPGLTQGYVVAANNGQTYQGQAQRVTVSVGGVAQPVTGCSPCVTVGLTPQMLGQFIPVGLPSTNPFASSFPGNPSLAGVVPVKAGPSFANPYGGTKGNNGSIEFGANYTMTLTAPGQTTPGFAQTTGGLLDSGTPGLALTAKANGQIGNGTTISVTGATQTTPATPIAGLGTYTATLNSASQTYAPSLASGNTNTIGLSFFLQNSVMYDLTDGVIGYTPFFVTDAPLATTASGPLIVDASSVPLGLAGGISGPGGVMVNSGGALQLSATNTYTGLTTIAAASAGTPAGQLYISGPGSIASSAGVMNNGLFDISRAWGPVSIQSLAGAGQTNLGGQNLTITDGSGNFSGNIVDGGAFPGTGGSLTIAGGMQGLSGANTYTGPTVVSGGWLVLNGSVTSNVTVGSGGTLGGNGTVFGNVVNAGVVSPGNAPTIGTLSIVGNYTQALGSVYLAQVNAVGQSDKIAVAGTANIQGGSVIATPTAGAYAPRTTYALLTAAGGVSGAYASAASTSQFLIPTLSYDANDVYLTLQIGGFAAAAQTPAQQAVGGALDASAATATGDFATVLSALAQLNAAQVPSILTSLSGQNYAGFSNAMVQGAQLFMNNFLSQAGSANRGAGKVALAQACDVACDTATPAQWDAWGGALGGLGTVGQGLSTGAVTYNVGGFAAGLDRRLTDNFLAGVTAGYTSGTQWVSGFSGQSFSNTFQAGLYGGYLQGPVYLDGLVGYAYSANQMSRGILIPGLAPRTATGQTGANQFYGQVETGYRVDLGGAAEAFVTPFARLQAYTGTQNGFTEFGAQSLNLSVAAQTTNSLRTVLGAQLGGSIDLGWRDKLNGQFRLGWSHEFADTSRPVSATFVGAPSAPFTTYGASPQRDGVVIGVAANTAITQAASIYLRYEGDISGQDSSHALTAGVRLTW